MYSIGAFTSSYRKNVECIEQGHVVTNREEIFSLISITSIGLRFRLGHTRVGY
jgi:hypothetical protein